MTYKEICSKHISKLSIELLNNGMPIHNVSCLMLDICAVTEKHFEEEE